ncbi:MAG TPA: hypothetical protein VFZ61_02445 [Polyangiales bacterium]
MQPGIGIHRVSTDDLKRLLRAIHRGAISSPVTRASLIEKGFGNIEGHLKHVVARDSAGARAVIAAVLEERGAWEKRLARESS